MIAPVHPGSHALARVGADEKPFLRIDRVGKTFRRGPARTEVLRDIDLTIARGEYVAVIGHSGCGKSTLLNLVAGLTPVSTGAILLEDQEVSEPGPERAVVFQNHSLLPWLTAYENVRMAVDKVFSGKRAKPARHDWTIHDLELVHMGHAKDKRPAEISGGMKQRVGIARALAMEPKVLLLDEPFGALDALTRAHLQDQVMEIHARLGNTVIMITHDVDEAVLLSDRIVMMTNGPAATIGEVLEVELPRPRKRLELVSNRTYVAARSRAAVPLRTSQGSRRRRRGLIVALGNSSLRESMAKSDKQKLVVICNGMAPGRALDKMFEQAPDAYDVTIFNAEPRVNYDRIMLSPVLSGEKSFDQIVIHGDGWYVKHGVKLYKGCTVTNINREARTVTSATGITVPYDKLIIATGSLPIVIPVPGHNRGHLPAAQLGDQLGKRHGPRRRRR